MATPILDRARTTHWIAGDWQESDTDTSIDVTDPSNESRLATVPAGTATDAKRGVAAAKAALPCWSETPLAQRIDFLRRLVTHLQHRAEEFADIITCEVGAPIMMARRAQVGLAMEMAKSYLDIAAEFEFERRVGHSLIVREPVGVVATITPWNVPLLLSLQKIVPALLAGCTVMHKPSEIAPLHAYLLAEVMADCDFPPGVFNMVVGTGPVVGTELARHPDVDLVSLTGSTQAGRQVAAIAAEQLKRVHLELGGKNASIVLDDADLASAVKATVDQMCFNTGQTCLQWSRLLVPQQRHDEAVELAAGLVDHYRVGDPRDPTTDIGPLISAAAVDRVRGYIRQGIEQGAQLAAGGPDRPEHLTRGYWLRPTVFGGVDESMHLAREEIFGPVLSVMPYDGEPEAVRIANATPYGLHGAIWSADVDRARRVAGRLRTGMVDINGGPFNILAPFGGVKQSGIGRECGIEGLDGYCEIKSIQLPVESAEPVGPRLHTT